MREGGNTDEGLFDVPGVGEAGTDRAPRGRSC